jgi:hypothetical protein
MSKSTRSQPRPLVLLVDPDVSRARRFSLGLRLGGFLVMMATRVSDARALIDLLPPAVVIAHGSAITPPDGSPGSAPDDLTTMGIPLVVYGGTDGAAAQETADTLVETVRRVLERTGDQS